MKSKKEIIKVILVNLLITVLLLSFIIVMFNTYAYRNDLRRMSVIHGSNRIENLRHALKPNTAVSIGGIEYKINSLGFRDKEYAVSKPVGCYRILCVGDSFTFGQGVKIEDTYPKVLERKLQDIYTIPIEVINTGVSGYNTYDEYWYIKNKLIRLIPDLIILCFYIGNDPEDPSIPFNSRMIIKDDALGKNIPLVRYLKEKNNKKVLEKEDYWTRYMDSIWDSSGEQWKKCVNALGNLKNLSEENNIELLVLIMPVMSPDPQKFLHYHRQLTSALEALDIQYTDALPELIKTSYVYLPASREDEHPNAKMYKIYTHVLLKTIEEKRLIKYK